MITTTEQQTTATPPISGERGPAQPQWSHQETAELISLRAQLERDFTASKRNKALWETLASRMRDKGFSRTPDLCKGKWKNLVNRYKGKETSDLDNGRQCPFFEELRAVFSDRAKAMGSKQVSLPSKRVKTNSSDHVSEDFSQDEGEEGEDSDERSRIQSSKTRKRKAEREKLVHRTAGDQAGGPVSASIPDISSNSRIHEMLKAFFQQQQRIEMQWREAMERHRSARELFEQEWHQSIEKLARERLMVEQEWREREEQRKMREEIRAEKRDALLITLLSKLIGEDQF